MINGLLSDFIDTGWYTESTLFYKDHIYWCEGTTNFDTGITTFFVDSWKAYTNDNLYYHSCVNKGHRIDYKRVYEVTGHDIDYIKKQFLTAPIFDGKSFWDVEKELVWLDEGAPIEESL
jgi:hypothetical protein